MVVVVAAAVVPVSAAVAAAADCNRLLPAEGFDALCQPVAPYHRLKYRALPKVGQKPIS